MINKYIYWNTDIIQVWWDELNGWDIKHIIDEYDYIIYKYIEWTRDWDWILVAIKWNEIYYTWLWHCSCYWPLGWDNYLIKIEYDYVIKIIWNYINWESKEDFINELNKIINKI